MKILGYVHTYNDADVIAGTIQALCDQTYSIPEILLIDNGSTDDTLKRVFPSKVTIIKNDRNLGTSGAVATGMKYALANGYEWIYILDADSRPESDAIENLMRCYHGLTAELQASTWWLSSLPKEPNNGSVHHGCVFTPSGIRMLAPPSEPSHYSSHTNMWSGSCYRLDAVKDVGLPDVNYVLDWGDVIYGYEGMIRGYTGFVEQTSVITHNLHAINTLHFRRFGARYVKLFNSPPFRFYYLWRNSSYFWMYKYRGENYIVLILSHWFQFLKWLVKAFLFIKRPWPVLVACIRGAWDGSRARLENRALENR